MVYTLVILFAVQSRKTPISHQTHVTKLVKVTLKLSLFTTLWEACRQLLLLADLGAFYSSGLLFQIIVLLIQIELRCVFLVSHMNDRLVVFFKRGLIRAVKVVPQRRLYTLLTHFLTLLLLLDVVPVRVGQVFGDVLGQSLFANMLVNLYVS